jgi:dihydrofolate reductase
MAGEKAGERLMSKVIVSLTVSLDGFIAGPHDGPENPLGDGGMRLFDWYFDGDTPSRFYAAAAARGVPVPTFKLSRISAEVFDELAESDGAVISGRRTYDIARDGWAGHGPTPGVPLFVVTHQVPADLPERPTDQGYAFVTDGIESALTQAKKVAADKHVSLMGSSVVQECLRKRLLDQIQLHVVPVLLRNGVRLFDHLADSEIDLKIIRVVDAPGVTHLRYRVVK